MDISSHFNNFFELKYCRSHATINRCQHLRYLAYCEEHGFLDTDLYPDKMEADEYDDYAEHILIEHRETGIETATVRLVLCNEQNGNTRFPIESFPILRRMKRDGPWRDMAKDRIGEISRFSISKTFRRRVEERNVIHGITNATFMIGDSGKRHMADITLGLFKAVVMLSDRHDLTHWYALMEPALIRLLKRFGIQFNMVGPKITFFGVRQPCIAKISDVLSGIYRHNPDIWYFITDRGRCYEFSGQAKLDSVESA